MRVYRMIIRPKVDYGSAVYGAANKTFGILTQSNFFAAGCKIMKHYEKSKIMQNYAIHGDISLHFPLLIAVKDCLCGDNLIGI